MREWVAMAAGVTAIRHPIDGGRSRDLLVTVRGTPLAKSSARGNGDR